jgi:hypothetical protein
MITDTNILNNSFREAEDAGTGQLPRRPMVADCVKEMTANDYTIALRVWTPQL